MRLLLDECVDPRVRDLFGDHEVATVQEEGWAAQEDGPLLRLAQMQFDVFLTIDGNLEHQQNIGQLALGVVVVRVSKNQISYYRVIAGELLRAVETVRPGQVIHVSAVTGLIP